MQNQNLYLNLLPNANRNYGRVAVGTGQMENTAEKDFSTYTALFILGFKAQDPFLSMQVFQISYNSNFAYL